MATIKLAATREYEVEAVTCSGCGKPDSGTPWMELCRECHGAWLDSADRDTAWRVEQVMREAWAAKRREAGIKAQAAALLDQAVGR